LLRTAALVGGTAAVAHHAGRKSQAAQDQNASQDAAIADMQQQQAAPAAAPAPAAPAAPVSSGPSQEGLDKLKELAQLHDQGILTDEEFFAQKAKILGS
jgi:Short C-terminal domain